VFIDCVSNEFEFDFLYGSLALGVVKGALGTSVLSIDEHILVESYTVLAAFVAQGHCFVDLGGPRKLLGYDEGSFERYRSKLPSLIANLGFQRILDAECVQVLVHMQGRGYPTV